MMVGIRLRKRCGFSGCVCQQPDCPLIPVHATSGCAGHLRRTARGFLAYDCDDKPIGIFTNTDDGARALLDQQSNGEE
jgi:hypothetical protein